MADFEPPTPSDPSAHGPQPPEPQSPDLRPQDPYRGYPPPMSGPPEPYAGPEPYQPPRTYAGGPQYGDSQYGDSQYGDPQPYPEAPYPGPTAATRASGTRRTILVAAVVAALIGGGVGAGTVALVDRHDTTTAAGLNYTSQSAPAPKLDGSITAAAAKISPSVVTINVSSSQEADTGSGVILRSDGYILTNNHVIAAAAGGAGTVSVTLADGKILPAKIIGQDASDDLAVVKVSASGLTAATFAASSALQVGQSVVAVGAPLGLSDTVTSGIVSNTARPVQTGDSNTDQAVFDAIQTDAAINPGNSGGPLVNLNGDVVGINAAIATDQSSGGLQVPGQPQSQAGSIGIGFAIPSDEASRIAGQLIATGRATHAVIGVTVEQTTAPTSVGATVKGVTAGGPAAKAGIKAGDVVTQVDSQRIASADALIAAIRSHAPAQQVTIGYLRGGAAHTTTVTLGEAGS